MRFAKWHGIGNDFVMLADPEDVLSLSPESVRYLCDRRTGIGGDGVIRIAPGTDGTDLFMDYLNSDGSIGEMCGNGIRCLALYARQEGLTDKDTLKVGTRAGTKQVWVDGDRVRVDMDPPIFDPPKVPVIWSGPEALHAKVTLEDRTLEAACLGMGNPHAVLFVDEPNQVDIQHLGPRIEWNPIFPNGTNTEFIKVESPTRVRMRVWERGSGETLACGTGAAAVAVVARLLGGADEEMTVGLPGGELHLEWAGSLNDEKSVFMTGPAVQVFSGEVDVPS
ncbi:MAG: diaminopimelate epimerase [Actinomycetota bacterium]|jgi:diaminopimelate epimerase|nr:diaminopimelate epimerase [Actinomycetota bacterium]